MRRRGTRQAEVGDRHLWVAAIMVGGAAVATASAAAGLSGSPLGAYLGAVPAILLVAAATATRRLRVDVAVTAVLGIGLVLFAVRVLTADATADVAADMGAVGMRAITLLSGVAFIALGHVRGLVVAGITWATALVVLAAGPVPVELLTPRGSGGLLGVAVFGAVVILMFRVLSERASDARVQAEVAQESAELAFLDELTGLPNRRQMALHLRAAVARAVEGGGPDTLVLFDLDRFKVINDTLGHDAGDEVLRRTAAVASAVLRRGDVLGRWGGEEFLLLATDADARTGRELAERCRRALAGVTGPTAVTASFGVTTIDSADTVTDALRRADLALYDAKQGGRNQVVVRGLERYPSVVEGEGGDGLRLPDGRPPR